MRLSHLTTPSSGASIAVEAFAATTVARFGRIDVWVNSTGVIAYGEFLEIPPDVFRQGSALTAGPFSPGRVRSQPVNPRI